MIVAAAAPPERRGVERDRVRLLVARPRAIEHRTFRELPDLLAPGDVVVVNTSSTLPAAVDATIDGDRLPLHVSTVLDDGAWVVELRRPDGSGPDVRGRPGVTAALPGHLVLTLVEPFPDHTASRSRLWRAAPSAVIDVAGYLMRHGRPIRYGHQPSPLPLADYQNVYAAIPGSAEMPSAGRPLTEAVLTRLTARGILVTPLLLHAGVSSPELHEPPAPERYEVLEITAATVNAARARGSRVVATGTTVVRALETAATEDGMVRQSWGWTALVLSPARPARVVDGLITGLHEPESSHILLLHAVAGEPLVRAAYAAADAHHYLGHEFGDSMLLLP